MTLNWNWINWFDIWIYCSNHQPIGNGYVYSIFGLILAFFCCGFGFAWNWLAENFLQKWRWLFFFVVATRLSCKKMCTVTAKQQNCRFLVLKRNIQNVIAGFALFTVVETSHFIGWNVNTFFVFTCWTIHISNSLLYFVVHTQAFLSVFGWFKWTIK